MKTVMNMIVTIVATIAVMIPFVIATAVPVEAEDFGRSALDRVSNALGHVILGLEEPEPPAAVGDVVDVIGECLREPVYLVDERRDEEEPEERGRRARGRP